MGVEGIINFFNIFCPVLLLFNGIIMIYTAVLESRRENNTEESPKESQRCQDTSDVRNRWEGLNIN